MLLPDGVAGWFSTKSRPQQAADILGLCSRGFRLPGGLVAVRLEEELPRQEAEALRHPLPPERKLFGWLVAGGLFSPSSTKAPQRVFEAGRKGHSAIMPVLLRAEYVQ